MSGTELAEECRGCRPTAAGPDGFEPAEMAMLSMKVYEEMARLLNLIEDGAEWPEGMGEARAAFMQKEEGKVDDPLKFRVLKILPALYRRWAAARLRKLAQVFGRCEYSTKSL